MKWFLFNKVNLVSYLLGQNMLKLIVSCLTIVYVGLVIIVYIKSKKRGGFDNLPFVKNMWYFLINPRLPRRPPYFFRGSLFPGQARKLIPDCFFCIEPIRYHNKGYIPYTGKKSQVWFRFKIFYFGNWCFKNIIVNLAHYFLPVLVHRQRRPFQPFAYSVSWLQGEPPHCRIYPYENEAHPLLTYHIVV